MSPTGGTYVRNVQVLVQLDLILNVEESYAVFYCCMAILALRARTDKRRSTG